MHFAPSITSVRALILMFYIKYGNLSVSAQHQHQRWLIYSPVLIKLLRTGSCCCWFWELRYFLWISPRGEENYPEKERSFFTENPEVRTGGGRRTFRVSLADTWRWWTATCSIVRDDGGLSQLHIRITLTLILIAAGALFLGTVRSFFCYRSYFLAFWWIYLPVSCHAD